MKVRRLTSQHSTYPGLFSRPGSEPDSARHIPEFFNPDPNESKKAEKMLELALSQVFLGLDENPTDLTPTIDNTHKNKSKDSWRDIIQKYRDTPTMIKAYI
jgi:hypothetical protein